MKTSFVLKSLALFAIFIALLSFAPQETAQGGLSYVTPLQKHEVPLSQINNISVVGANSSPIELPQRSKSHAPEPSSLFLFMTGMVGIVVRFAQKSFKAFKRVMDYAIALTAVIVAAPLFLMIALLVKLTSKGPVFYRQCRVGKDGKNFMILKFRSMRADAEKGTGAVWAKANDPRLTPIGNFLRKSHLDELPQLINVLKGDMSIVGPRPERPEIVKDLKKVISDYDKRLAVLPGITGMAQVMNRYDETISDVRKKVKYDILYIKKMCWLVEMRVMALTFVVMLTGKGAR